MLKSLTGSLHICQWLLIGSFLALLWGPLLGSLLSPDRQVSEVENRPLAQLPAWPDDRSSLRDWPRRFEAYFDDQLGGRETLVYWHNRIKLALGIAPSDKVLPGRESWLFYAGTEADGQVDPIRDLRGKSLFSEHELAAWAANLNSKQRWLAARGIAYLFVIAPNKSSIYPEYLPARIQPGPSRTDQLVQYLAQHSTVPLLDLRPALLAAKADGQLYHRTDSHWNALGAWHAQQAIQMQLRHWFPELAALPHHSWSWQQQTGGDLAQMLGLRQVLREPKPQAQEGCYQVRRQLQPEPPHSQIVGCDRALWQGLLFHDSFADALAAYLAHYFHDLTMLSIRPDLAYFTRLVAETQPDIVIEQRVERYLALIPDYALPAD